MKVCDKIMIQYCYYSTSGKIGFKLETIYFEEVLFIISSTVQRNFQMSDRISDALKELADISIGSSESNHYADFVFSRDVFKVQSYNSNINRDNEDLDCTNEFNVSNISIEPTFCEDNSDDDETSIRSSLSLNTVNGIPLMSEP